MVVAEAVTDSRVPSGRIRLTEESRVLVEGRGLFEFQRDMIVHSSPRE